jgi:2-polyprenyl-3-methyl-5-hydroxy-6-metoxy-1,4-benzoquinol methylase
MSHPSAFWDRIATRYAKAPVADEASYQHKLAVTRQHLSPQSEVLEFGCGTGSTAVELAPHVAHYLATDISANMLAIARDKGPQHPHLEFQQAAIEDVPGEALFDVILGMSILHLVDDLDATLAHVSRLLRPGGVFVSSTMCMADAYGWFRFVGPLGRALGLFPRVAMLKRSYLVNRIEAAGFRIDYRFQPTSRKATFLVAVKPTGAGDG